MRRPLIGVLLALFAGLGVPAVASGAAPAVTVAPQVSGSAHEGQALTAGDGSWTGTPTIAYTRQWLRCDGSGLDCTPLAATNPTYTLTAADVSSTVRVRVQATNGEGTAYAQSPATAAVTGTPPVNTVAPTVGGPLRSGQLLTAAKGTWSGTQPTTYAYAWRRCDATGGACVSIPGATATTYALTDADVDARIRVRVTGSNAAGTGEGTSAASAAIAPAQPPVNSVAPSLLGTARDASTLSIDRGTWSGTPTIAFTQAWASCDTFGAGCAPIAGATLATYVLRSSDVGRRIRATVTAVNPDGSSASQTALSDPVAVNPPASTAVPRIVGATRIGQTLTAQPGTWTGTPDLDYAHVWLRCDDDGTHCAPIPGAAQETYVQQDADLAARLVVRVTASNPAGSATRDSAAAAVVTAAQPPVNTIAPPVSGTARDGQTLSAASGTWSGFAGITYGYQWLRCDADGTACADIDGATAQAHRLAPVDVDRAVRVRVRAQNPDGVALAQSAALLVAPSPPVATAAPSLTGVARDEQRLSVTTGTWTGTPTVSYAHAWERCNSAGAACVAIAGATSATFDLTVDDIASRIRARVTATNAGGSVASVSSPTVAVDAAPPETSVSPSLTGTPRDGQLLTAQRGTWTGTQPITYAWQWRRCNATGTTCANIAGATDQTYRLTPADLGSSVRIRVDATNRKALVGRESAGTAVVAADPPALTAAPAIAGAAQDGALLTAANGTWTGTPTLAFTLQWQRCVTPGDCMAIAGATQAGYRLTAADIDATVRLRVTASNGGGARSELSADTAPVAPVAPAAADAPAITGTTRHGRVLSAGAGTWTGTVPQTRSYQWRRCDGAGAACVDLVGETGATHLANAGDVGATLRVRVTSTNAAGSATAVSERTAIIDPDPPVNTVAATILGVPRDGATLTVDEGAWTGTPTLQYAYQWQRCSGSVASPRCDDVAGAANRSYALRTTDVGFTMRAVLTAANAGGAASRTLGATGVVQPNPPVNTALPAVTGTVRDGEELTTTAGSWTGVITFAFAYQWYRCDAGGANCGSVTGATQPTFTLTPTDVGLTLRVEVTARNAGGQTAVTSHATAVGTPRPPGALALPRITGYTGLGQTMTVDDGGWLGSPPLAFTRRWLRCDAAGDACAPIPGSTGRSYELTADDLGHKLRAQVFATNPAGAADATSAATRVVSDDPPVNLALPTIGTPSVVAQGVVLTADGGAWEGAGPLTPAYRWRRCNPLGVACADITGATGATYVPTADDLGQTLRATVTMDNGVGAASATSAPAGPVLPAPPALAVTPIVKANGALAPGTELIAGQGTWTGAEPIAYSFGWQRCAADGSGCVPIAGTGAAKYVLTDADVGASLRARVTASNPTLTVAADTELVGPVGALAPTATGKPKLLLDGGTQAKARTGGLARGDGGIWVGTAPMAFAYRWQRCASASDCADVPGADGLAYTFADADVGARLRLVVVARNVAGSVTATSPLSDVVAGNPPAAVSKPVVTVASSALRDGAQLTAEPGGWSGSGTLAFSYQWQRCPPAGTACKPIPKALESTYTAVTADVGQRLSVVVSARSTAGKADAQSAATDVVTAVAPANRVRPAIERAPGKLEAGAKLTSTLGTWAGSEKIAYTHQWLRCSRTGAGCRAIEGATKPIYDAQPADFRKEKLAVSLRVAVTARNAAGGVTATSRPFGGRSPAGSALAEAGEAAASRVPLSTKTAGFDAKGRLVVRIACAPGGAACAGRLRIASSAYARTLKFSKLRAGKARRWALRLKRPQQRTAGRARTVPATLTMTVTGEAAPHTLKVRIKVPARLAARWGRI